MTNDINGIGNINNLPTTTTQKNTTENQQAEESIRQDAARTEQSDSVEVSSQSQKISDLIDKINELPEIDQQRVDAVKSSIEDGNYQVDANKIAQKILDEQF